MSDAHERDTPLTLSEVRIQKPRRKRGGQPGNRNRLSHGGFSAKAKERQASIRMLIASTNALITRVEMVARARCALKAKIKKIVIRGERVARGKGIQVIQAGPISTIPDSPIFRHKAAAPPGSPSLGAQTRASPGMTVKRIRPRQARHQFNRETGSVDSRSQPLELIFDAKLLLLESGDPVFVPIGMGHFIFDELLQFLMLFGELLNMPLKSHARTSQLEPPQLDHYRALVSRPSSAYALCNVNQ